MSILTNCAHRFLTEEVARVFQTKDAEGINRLYSCLDKVHKNSFLDRVPHSYSGVPVYMIADFKASAYNMAWEDFCTQMNTGKTIYNPDCIGYFFIIFKRKYLKLLDSEKRRIEREKEMGWRAHASQQKETDISKIKAVLAELGIDCAKLLVERKVQRIPAETMAAARQVKPETINQMVWRCKKRFLEIWNNIKIE